MLETNFCTWAFSTHPFMSMVKENVENDVDFSVEESVYVLAYNLFQSIKCSILVIPQYFFDEHNFNITCEHLHIYYEISCFAFRIIFDDSPIDVESDILFSRTRDLFRSLYVPYDDADFHQTKFRGFNAEHPNCHLVHLTDCALKMSSHQELITLFVELKPEFDWQVKAALKYLIKYPFREQESEEKSELIESKIIALSYWLYKNHNILTVEISPTLDTDSTHVGFLDADLKPILPRALGLDDETIEMLEEIDLQKEVYDFVPADHEIACSLISVLDNTESFHKKGAISTVHRLIGVDDELINKKLEEYAKTMSTDDVAAEAVFEEASIEDMEKLVDILEFSLKKGLDELSGKLTWILVYNFAYENDMPGYKELVSESLNLIDQGFKFLKVPKSISCFSSYPYILEKKSDLLSAENLYEFCLEFAKTEYKFMDQFEDYVKVTFLVI